MILVRKDVIGAWLKTIRRNQAWLALKMGYTNGYISQVLNNRCKISTDFIERIQALSHMTFEDLFISNGEPDTREFYGEVYFLGGRVMNKREYFAAMKEKQTFTEEDLYRDKKNHGQIYFQKVVDKSKSVVL